MKESAREAVEIQTNPMSILAFVGVIILLSLSLFLNNLVVSVVSLAGIVGVVLYLIQNYYVIKPKSSSSGQ
ncbi:hypothetical protein [Listeria ivanovii]|uniref:hypothetical protein n=1 Tax=Listeria ivanovii TaxID=1638 RepID=UPI001F266536|nr:hypothetical protein [Listeria ivanovii]